MDTKFKITGPGLYKRRDDSTANLVGDQGNDIWKDTYTNFLYYENGYYGSEPDESPNDIVARLDGAGNILQINPQPAIEYVPDRLGIAAQILAGFCADPKASCVDDHEVERAVELADKLIARVRATYK